MDKIATEDLISNIIMNADHNLNKNSMLIEGEDDVAELFQGYATKYVSRIALDISNVTDKQELMEELDSELIELSYLQLALRYYKEECSRQLELEDTDKSTKLSLVSEELKQKQR